jgi:hypothetical protein
VIYNLHGYALDYKSGLADKTESIRETVVAEGSGSRKEKELISILRSSFVTEKRGHSQSSKEWSDY